jgi:competence protein ComEC
MTLFWFTLAWLGGIAAGQASHLNWWPWLGLAVVALSAAVLFRNHRIYRGAFLGVLALTLGAARSAAVLPPGPGSVASYNDRPDLITLQGMVVDTPDERDTYTGLRLEVETLLLPDDSQPRAVHGRVLVYASRLEDWHFGDRVEAQGELQTPPIFETFSYRDYLARQGIHSLMPDARVTRLASRQAHAVSQAIHDYRALALDRVYDLFPDPEASLLAGILLGIESGIPPDVRQAFDRTGTSHIIAISGFNITIVAGLFIGLFGRWLGQRRGAVVAGLAIAVYTLLVGADPPVGRAAIMGGLGLLARRLGRQTDGLASLGAAALGMTVFHPLILWDAGFQLSFAATLGLILYATPLKDGLIRRLSSRFSPELATRLAHPVSEFGLFTLAAQATTLPLTVYYFQRLSPSSLLANPVILPAQPLLMVGGGLAAMVATIWEPLGRPLAWITWPFAAFTIRTVEWFAALPFAAVPLGRVTLPTVMLLYAALFGLTALAQSPEQHLRRLRLPRLRLPVWLGWSGAGIAIVLVWGLVMARPDGRLHVVVLNVGSGDATLVTTPAGRRVLIDGGPSTLALSSALGRRLSPLDRGIDWLVVSGSGDHQLAGLAATIERFPIGQALLAGTPSGEAYRRLLEALTEAGCPMDEAQAGHALELGDGARLEIIGAGAHGAVLLLEYGSMRVLLAPGADPALIDSLSSAPGPGPVTAVVLAESGEAAVNPAGWLDQLHPRLAIVSVEAGDWRGLPSPETLEALAGTTILRTDQHGWIELISDGERMWVEVERPVAPVE